MRTIKGVQVLLCTPMTETGGLDYASTERLIEHVIGGGVQGIILLGSTGEFFSLSEKERMRFTVWAVARIHGRAAVGVCCAAAGTVPATMLARHAERSGADYLLVPVPYYFQNTLAGVADFYAQVAGSVSIPIMPYDGGGGNSLDMETWRRVVNSSPNVTLAKVTVPLPPKIKWLHEEFGGRVDAFGGSDQTILLALAYGGRGLTVAGANVVPRAFAQMFELYETGSRDEARRVYYERISPMNVIAVPAHTEFVQCYKQALYWMGIIDSPHTRGPLMALDAMRKAELSAALRIMGVEMPRCRDLAGDGRRSGDPAGSRLHDLAGLRS